MDKAIYVIDSQMKKWEATPGLLFVSAVLNQLLVIRDETGQVIESQWTPIPSYGEHLARQTIYQTTQDPDKN